MNEHTFEKLQYKQLIENVKQYCSSGLGRSLADEITPSKNIELVKQKLKETSEAKSILNISSNIGIIGTENIKELITDVEKDVILNESQLYQVLNFLKGNKKVKNFMKDKEFYAPYLCAVSGGIVVLDDIIEEIDSSIKNAKISNDASTTLKNTRRHIMNLNAQIKEGLDKFLRNKNNQDYIQEFFISNRNGRQTIPIKASYKNSVSGTIIDSTAKTVFIEPTNVSKHSIKLERYKIEEAEEEYRILCKLTSLIYDNLDDIKRNMETLAFLDLIFAKGKYANAIDANEPEVNNYGYIKIINGKHMLLKGDVVPLNIEVGNDFRSLIITGPNAGGKTVVLKTIGLLTLAVQSGLHIPCNKGTNISVFERIFADIGDDQSIENALSTFSSHVKNLAHCINKTNKSTLLLFDELGSGTEPNEGVALAIAILEDVYKKGAITIATTHYNEIKNYSLQHSDFENAAMKFNKETLEPLYKLIIGKLGESNSLWIAEKMGINDHVLNKAEKYMNDKKYDISVLDKTKIRSRQDKSIEKKYYDYKIGDRVYVKTLDKSGIVYKPKDNQSNVQVFFNGEVESLHIRLLTLEGKSEDLYPSGYNMDQLFRSYKERKLERDIERGSKKTLKKIRKYGMDELLK